MNNINLGEVQGKPPYFGWDTCPDCGKVSKPTSTENLSGIYPSFSFVWKCKCGNGRLVTTMYDPTLDWVVLTNQFKIKS